MKLSDMSREDLASKLLLSVINYEENKERLMNFPFVIKGEFAVLSQLCVGEKNTEGQHTACLTVTNDMLAQMRITKDELFEFSKENSKALLPAVIQPVTKYMDGTEAIGIVMLPNGIDLSEIYVLTNEHHFNGAATIFYEPEILGVMAEELNSEKIILLPSSINEIYCLPIRNAEDEQEYQEIFGGLSDILSDESLHIKSVLTYDNISGEIREMDGTTYEPELVPVNVNRHMSGR